MTKQRVKTPRSALARALVLACAIVAACALGPASAAHAGTYRVYECNSISGNASAPDAASISPGSPYYTFADCANGNISGGIGSLNGNSAAAASAGQIGGYQLSAPGGTLIRNLNVDVWGQSSDVCGNYATFTVRDDGGAPQMHRYFTANTGLDCGPTTLQPNCASVVPAFCHESSGGLNMGARDIRIYLQCFPHTGLSICHPPPTGPGGGNQAGWALMKNLDVVLEDMVRPSGPMLSGSIVAGGPRRGTESLTASLHDSGSGLQAVRVLANGGQVEQKTYACQTIPENGGARQFTPCPANATETFALNTDAGPWHEGANTLTVCATDYANEASVGNERCVDRAIGVDNSCDDSTGSTTGSNLDAGLARGNEQPQVTAVVSSKDGIQVKGSVTAAGGAPVPGANVCLYQQTSGVGEERALADIVHTRANGSFAGSIDPGPSREIYVDYRHSNLVLEKHLNLESTTSPLLRIRKKHVRNGKSMRFEGSIPGPYNAGRIVTMQAKVGKKWKTFLQATTDTAGQYKGRYRFKHSTVRRAKYRFRALVKEQSGYPFKKGISKAVKVIVKG